MDEQQPAGPLTLGIDIGGTKLKCGILDGEGVLIAEQRRMDTPHPATPDAVIGALVEMASKLGSFDRISIGFPGVVRSGHVVTAPNLGTDAWRSFPLADTLSNTLGHPARMLNDGSVQGLGVVSGQGLECVITLGTGIGFALFSDGRLAPHLEIGQHPFRKDKTYDGYIGNAALHDVGPRKWNRRVQRAIATLGILVGFDTLYIGGGNTKDITFVLPPNVRIVSNKAGITGGVKLWDPRLDEVFQDRGSRLDHALAHS